MPFSVGAEGGENLLGRLPDGWIRMDQLIGLRLDC